MHLPPIRGWVALLRSRFYYLLGSSYHYFGNKNHLVSEYEHAVEAYTCAMTLDPTYGRAYMERGILYWRELNHPRRAVLDLTRASELDPMLTEARFNRGIAHQLLREYREAVEDYQAYLAVGEHPYWREYAESMIRELSEWVQTAPEDPAPPVETPV